MEVNHAIPIWRFMEFRKEGVGRWVAGSTYKSSILDFMNC